VIRKNLFIYISTLFYVFIAFTPGWALGEYYTCEGVGLGTINEVYEWGQTNFLEIHIDDAQVNPEDLSARVCIQKGNNARNTDCDTYDLDDAEEYHPYYLFNLAQGSVRLEQNAQMDIILFQNAGLFGNIHIVYDYLSINGYTYQQPDCEFDLDTSIDTTSNYKGIARLPDGYGPWKQIDGPGPRNEATPGESNDGNSLPEIHHFRMEHPSTALTCQSALVTVQACQNADCSELYPNDIRLSLSPEGWIGGSGQNLAASSTGSYRLKHTSPGTVEVGVTSPDVISEQGPMCYVNGDLSDCTIEFLDSGFVISVEDGRSCAELEGHIQAVQKDDETNRCIGDASFANTSRDVGFWFDYVNPSSGNTAAYLNGTELGSTQTSTSTTLDFNPGAEAAFLFSYADAGQLRLHALFSGTGEDAGLNMTGESAPFVMAPHHFEVTSPLNNSGSGGSPRGIAGEPFSATITAVCADGSITPNFSAPATLSAQAPFEPGGGTLGVLANTQIAPGMFASGSAEPDNLSYTEVGNFTLQAQASDYLGSGMDISGSAVVGRFIPHHFELVQGTLTNRVENSCIPASSFTYLGENLEFTYELSAKNASGNTTENYVEPFHKFSGDDGETPFADTVYTVDAIDDPDGSATMLSDRLGIETLERSGAWTQGGATFTVRLDVARNTTPDGPFADTRFGVFIQDGDGVKIQNPALDLDGDGTGDATQAAPATALRHGRIRLVNAYGPELLQLELPFYAEYFDANTFVTNDQDSCTTPALSDFVFTHDTGSNGDPILAQQISHGEGVLAWNNPPYTPGSIDIELDLSGTGSDTPFLQYDWSGDGAYTENPRARATFGIFRGSEHIIYMRGSAWD